MRKIPVSEEVWKETAAHIFANPPKFPLLKGSEKEQIVTLLTNLTDSGAINWFKLFVNPTAFFYVADYRGLRFKGCDLFGRNTLAIIPLDVFSQRTQNGTSFVSDKVQELRVAIKKQDPPSEDFVRHGLDRSDNKTFLEKVWGILNS